MCGRWVTARRSLGRTAARIQRSRSTPCARRDSSRATSDASSTGAPQRRSSFNRSARWRRSGIRVLLRASSASPSPGSPPGGSAGRTTCSRCRAGIGGFASSSTGRWRCSSGRTLRSRVARRADTEALMAFARGRLELTKVRTPKLVRGIEPAIAPLNTLDLRSVMFTVEARLRANGRPSTPRIMRSSKTTRAYVGLRRQSDGGQAPPRRRLTPADR